VKRLLRKNPSLATAVDVGGMMPLHCCAASRLGDGTRRVAELLLAHGAKVDERDRAHERGLWSPGTPIAWAANGNEHVAELLLERGADPNGALLQALQHCPAIADLLLRYRVDLNHPSAQGQRVLHHLANFPRPAAVAWLLAHGADVNVCMDDGRTPLHRAAERNSGTNVVEMLLAVGAAVNARDAAGLTPLGYALQNQKTKVAAFLRRHGATG
jgi:ankyrin repeat protein